MTNKNHSEVFFFVKFPANNFLSLPTTAMSETFTDRDLNYKNANTNVTQPNVANPGWPRRRSEADISPFNPCQII